MFKGSMFKDEFCDAAIEQRFGIALPAGLKNLSTSTRLQIKADHKRVLDNIRMKLKAGQEIQAADLIRR